MLSAETSLQTKFSDIIHDDSELAKLVILYYYLAFFSASHSTALKSPVLLIQTTQ